MLKAFLKWIFPSSIKKLIGTGVHFYQLRRSRFVLERKRPYRSFDGRHVAVVGVFSNRTGLSRAAELVSLTLESRGSIVSRVDVPSADKKSHDKRWITIAECQLLDISDVVIVLGPQHPILSAFDRNWILGRTIIAHWIWEIESIPEFWQDASKSYDEIWAATELLADSFTRGLPGFHKPIKIVPYAIHLDPFPKIDPAHRAVVRQRERLSNSDFVIGYSFSVDSNYYRKNPEDAVRAFRQAFPDRDDGRLFLRSNDLNHRPIERARLEAVINGDRRISIYDTSNHISIRDFYSAIDVYLSPSRAEGYGLNLVEAAQAGLPVITGAWRIAAEILSLPNVKTVGFTLETLHDPQGHYSDVRNAVWSAPDVGELASALACIDRVR